MTIHDVAIVGAGPAGSSLAISLAKGNYNVLLLEKCCFPRPKTCGDLVNARALTRLDELGCLDPINQNGYLPLRAASTSLNGECLSRGPIPHLPGMVDHAYAVPRKTLDEILFARAQRVGARTEQECNVREISHEKDRICIRADQADKSVKFYARLVVGADGPHSVVARQAGLEMSDPRHVEYALRAYCSGLPIREPMMLFEEEFFPGFGWVFPVSDGLANVGVGLVCEAIKKFNLDLRCFFSQLKERLTRWAAERNCRIEFDEPKGWPLKTYGGAGRNFFERGLLIGEAGCFVDPMSGEGIPLALESSALAAETIKTAFDRGNFSHEILAKYEQTWRSSFDPDLRISDMIVSVTRNRYLSKVWIEMLRLGCKTAESNPDYAWKMGGIIAGTIPTREGLEPEVVLRPFLQMIRESTNSFTAPYVQLPQLLGRAIEFGMWEVSTLAKLANDSDWFMNWCNEVAEKQRLVVANQKMIN